MFNAHEALDNYEEEEARRVARELGIKNAAPRAGLSDAEFVAALTGTRPAEPESEAGVNLRLLLPPRVEVDIVDWRLETDPVTGRDIRVPFTRRASISCFVPMRIFHKMLAGRERVMRLKRMAEAGESGVSENSGDYLEWVVEMTHAVWQLTEPWMERDVFESGLDMDQILGLFESFFGEQMRRFAERSRFQKATRSL